MSHFSIVFKVFKAIHTVYCELSFDLTTVHGKNYQNFFDKTYDYCAFMVKPPSEFLMLLVHGELSKAGLWMRKCPVEKVCTHFDAYSFLFSNIIGALDQWYKLRWLICFFFFNSKKTYKANNFTLNLERFPLFTPEARYNVTLMWTTKLKEEIVHLATITVLGRFESTVEVVRRRKAIGRKPTQPKTQPKTREFKPTS